MEYSLYNFTTKLKELFVNSALFPEYVMYENGTTSWEKSKKQSDESKHPDRHPVHLKKVAKDSIDTTTMINETSASFDYGSAVLETKYPYYHILENSPVIRKRNKGTTKSKGSESMYNIKAQRDYERVMWNGKTFTKEYSKNVRGARNRAKNVSHWGIVDGQSAYINADSSAYLNVHYQYIEKILDNDVCYQLAAIFGMKLKRIENTGIVDEFAYQEDTDVATVLKAFESFM